MTSSDRLGGLAALDQDREAKTANRRPPRPVPPPKKYAPSERPAAREDAEAQPSNARGAEVIDLREDQESAAPAEQPQVPTEGHKAPRRPPGAQKTQRTTAAPTGARDDGRVTAYLDAQHIDFLDDVRFNPARRRARIDVSGSAVLRFALERLAADMKPDEVYEAIAAKPVNEKAIGRKRR